MDTVSMLRSMIACKPALQWVEEQPDQSLARLWETCPRGEWLIWLAEKLEVLTAYELADLACRVLAPMALRVAGLYEQAYELQSLASVVDRKTAATAYDRCEDAARIAGCIYREACEEARNACYDACEAAAFYRGAACCAASHVENSAQIVRRHISFDPILQAAIRRGLSC